MASGFHWEVLRKASRHSRVSTRQHSPWLGIPRGAGAKFPSDTKAQLSAGVALPPPQQPAAARPQLGAPGRAPSVSVAPRCLMDAEIEMPTLPRSLRPVPFTEEHPQKTPPCFPISFSFEHREVFWSQGFVLGGVTKALQFITSETFSGRAYSIFSKHLFVLWARLRKLWRNLLHRVKGGFFPWLSCGRPALQDFQQALGLWVRPSGNPGHFIRSSYLVTFHVSFSK